MDDGSTDESFKIPKRLYEGNERLKVIRFRRNFGQTAAFAAGFDRSQGEVVITMDADLQNDLADILDAIMTKLHDEYGLAFFYRFLSAFVPASESLDLGLQQRGPKASLLGGCLQYSSESRLATALP